MRHVLATSESGAMAVVSPHGGVEARLATNPIAVGIPRLSAPHLVLDMSTSVASHGTIGPLELDGVRVPEGWSSDGTLMSDVERLVAHIRSARPRAAGVDAVVPGEHGELCRKRALAEGVRLPSPLREAFVE